MTADAQHRWQQVWNRWAWMDSKAQMHIAQRVIDRIIIAGDILTIRLSYAGIIDVISELGESATTESKIVCDAGFIPAITIHDAHLEITIAARFKIYGRTQMVVDTQGKPVRVFNKTNYNQTLVNAFVNSYRWNRLLDRGETTITELAAKAGLGRTYISRIVNLMFLAPDIVTSIFNGTQPQTLQLQDLLKNLPVDWKMQCL
jgi:hypothetical protein